MSRLWLDDGSEAKPGFFKVDTDTNMSWWRLFTMSRLSCRKLSLVYSRSIPIPIWVDKDCILWVDCWVGSSGLFKVDTDMSGRRLFSIGLFKVDTDTDMSRWRLFTMCRLSGRKLSLVYSRSIPIWVDNDLSMVYSRSILIWVDNDCLRYIRPQTISPPAQVSR